MNDFFKIGDIINTRSPNAYSFKTMDDWAFKVGVHSYSKQMFRNAKDKKAHWVTHSRMYLGDKSLSVTSPKTIFEDFDIYSYTQPISVLRYNYGFADIENEAILKMAESLLNTEYDYRQILGMGLHYLFPLFVNEDSHLISANLSKVVCSVGVLMCLVAGWKAGDRKSPRPGGDPMMNGSIFGPSGPYIEAAPPSLFNFHNTFSTVYKKNW
jgi:hypothetical protein